MKKTIVTLSVLLLTAVSVFAGGDNTKTTNYLYPRFGQGWFIDLAVTGSVFQTSDFVFHNFGPFHGPYIGASAKVGKMVSPSVGLRLAYDMHPSKNHHEAEIGYFSYKDLHFDVIWSILDGFNSYKPNRGYRLFLYGGAGLAGYDASARKIFYTKDSSLEFSINAGIMNSIRLSNYFDLHIDLQATAMRWSYDEPVVPDRHKIHTDLEAMLGFTYFFGGRNYGTCPTCEDADCSKQDAQIVALQDEIAQLRNQPTKPCDTVVKFVNVEKEGQLISTPFSIFFNKGSYEISSKKDIVNLGEIAKAAKEGGYRIRLRGTCDSATGSKEVNMRLSENRCRKVQQELVKLGVAEKDIIIDAEGGVSELTPAELDRRVFVELIK